MGKIIRKKDVVYVILLVYTVLFVIYALLKKTQRRTNICFPDFNCVRFCCFNKTTCNDTFIKKNFNGTGIPKLVALSNGSYTSDKSDDYYRILYEKPCDEMEKFDDKWEFSYVSNKCIMIDLLVFRTKLSCRVEQLHMTITLPIRTAFRTMLLRTARRPNGISTCVKRTSIFTGCCNTLVNLFVPVSQILIKPLTFSIVNVSGSDGHYICRLRMLEGFKNCCWQIDDVLFSGSCFELHWSWSNYLTSHVDFIRCGSDDCHWIFFVDHVDECNDLWHLVDIQVKFSFNVHDSCSRFLFQKFPTQPWRHKAIQILLLIRLWNHSFGSFLPSGRIFRDSSLSEVCSGYKYWILCSLCCNRSHRLDFIDLDGDKHFCDLKKLEYCRTQETPARERQARRQNI